MNTFKRLLWWLFAGSMGGVNRARIIHLLRKRPYNANQLTEELKLDYKTVRHHIEVLEKNSLIVSVGEKYGKMYSLSSYLEENMGFFDEIWVEIGKNNIKDIKNRG